MVLSELKLNGGFRVARMAGFIRGLPSSRDEWTQRPPDPHNTYMLTNPDTHAYAGTLMAHTVYAQRSVMEREDPGAYTWLRTDAHRSRCAHMLVYRGAHVFADSQVSLLYKYQKIPFVSVNKS